MDIFISLFSKHTSGTIKITIGKYIFEMDVKHNMRDYGRKFWINKGAYSTDFYVPLYWMGLVFSFRKDKSYE